MTYWYLATPYSKFKAGRVAAWEEACKAAAVLIRQGKPVYCPIAHTHPIAEHGQIDPYDHSIWLPADEPLMRGAEGLLIVKMQGWDESYGISEEIKVFQSMGKPIEYMEWPA